MILDDILYNFKTYSNELACKHDREYTYAELYELVCKIYELIKYAPKDRPIIVYGHKEVYMIASFLACSFLGIAYVPIDKMMNIERINYIINTVRPSYIIGEFENNNSCKVIKFKDIESVSSYGEISKIDMKPDDTYYIVFTSGTTGFPKGVMVTYENIDSCINWLKDVTRLNNHIAHYTIYNQAVFSFDLSVADIYLSLTTASNHYIGKDLSILHLKDVYEDLKNSNSNMMILTPSCAELFCKDSSFNQSLMPNLEKIIFCGEVLSKRLVNELYNRFENIKIINMYGPTECTYAVTSIEINKDAQEIIPIGYPKKDVEIFIVEDLKEKSEGEVGEILITGKSVAKGYINSSNNSFVNYNGIRGYLTGDIGYYQNGILYYVSRKDTQIKYKGYRIELSDIEKNIAKIDYVNNVKVKAEKDDNGNVKRITALVVLKDKSKEEYVRNNIYNSLPKYMIPILKFVDAVPININGKIDT